MSINEQIKELFNCHYPLLTQNRFLTQKDNEILIPPRLVYDGIVDEEMYSGIVFLLKETTEAGTSTLKGEEKQDMLSLPKDPNCNASWDFITTTKRRAIAQGSTPTNWKMLCYWIEAITNPEKSYYDAADCGTNLQKAAIINIKKTTGEGNADNSPLMPIAKDDKYSALIRKQIDLLNTHPNGAKMIVCCGTIDYALEIFHPTKIGMLPNKRKYFLLGDCVVWGFDHPSRPFISHEKFYNDFKETYQLLRNCI